MRLEPRGFAVFWSNILKWRSLALRSLFTSTQKENKEFLIFLLFAIFPKIPSGRQIGRCTFIMLQLGSDSSSLVRSPSLFHCAGRGEYPRNRLTPWYIKSSSLPFVGLIRTGGFIRYALMLSKAFWQAWSHSNSSPFPYYRMADTSLRGWISTWGYRSVSPVGFSTLGCSSEAMRYADAEVDGTRTLTPPFSLTVTQIEIRKCDPALRSKSDKL